MSSNVSYFKNAKHFVANPTFNTYISDGDALQYLHKHSATSAMHDSEERYPPPLCHEGTREAVVCRIEGWYGFEIPPKKKIMWVHAPAGYGKTAVAGTVSKKMESRTDLDFNPVGATFFFWRTSDERNSPARFIITLAYQFTMSIPELAPHIEAAVKRNPMVLNKALEVQLMKLIVEPFKSLGELDDMPHRLVIVDGLDECINSDQQSRVQKQYAEDQERVQVRVLDLILTLQSHHLPLCFLILSRPEPWIKQHFGSKSFQGVTEILDLYRVGDHMKDVEIFVRDELARIAESLEPQPIDDEQWPGEDLVQHFLLSAGGHMLYAATVIRHIDDPYGDPRQRLRDILNGKFYYTPDLAHSTPFSSLYELYRQILLSCPRTHQGTMVEVLEDILAFRNSLYSMFGTRTALDALHVLQRISGRTYDKAIRPLHAVISLSAQANEFFMFGMFYHSSFPEFLQSHPQISPDVTIDSRKGVRRLLEGCLKTLSSITLDSPVTEEHLRFALGSWGQYWRYWRPSDEVELSSMVKAFLAVDLTACFVHELESDPLTISRSISACIHHLYHPTENLIVANKSPPSPAPFFNDAVSHLRCSVEGAFMHFLQPGSIRDPKVLIVFRSDGARYFAEAFANRPPGFDKVIQALRNRPQFVDHLEDRFVFVYDEDEILLPLHQRVLIENMLKLVRQED
ncbi:hypothetical protein EST38_g6567 [Candolleomyces aberdarensis]|uniref:Nephrocystin 3-like N-terminal domain-containing protein n=1 Tax=Candolleomyces aberdarensis TaxID=2316362 RepID=A0A4Q2DHT6_9AGAR|nr:hypothetical protein EST38_g6567 [Candolleomyces aberdarensis]